MGIGSSLRVSTAGQKMRLRMLPENYLPDLYTPSPSPFSCSQELIRRSSVSQKLSHDDTSATQWDAEISLRHLRVPRKSPP